MWIHSRSTGSHLVSPPSGARPSPPALFAQVGSTEPGNEILLLTLKARQAVGEPVSARSCFFFLWEEVCALCVSCTRCESLAYAAVFMALQTHSVLPPRHLFGWLIVCVSIMRGGVGVVVVVGVFPFAPAPGFVSPFPA